MKTIHKILILLVVIASYCSVVQAYQYFNIYFYDGTKSEAFYTFDVDSIKCSKYDLNNVKHNDWIVQEIWTANSVYRYLLADIESISFTEGVKNELPAGKNALKVLTIGNSFLEDPMAYLDDIVRASGIDRSSLCVYSAVIGGSSLEYWANICQKGEKVTIDLRSGTMTMPTTQATLKELLSQDWDVVTVQQLSSLAQDANKFSPYLPYLINQIRENCPNKNVVIAWQQVWSYWGEDLDMSISNWQNISEVAELTYNYGIDMIIPTGTAIQNARGTELNTPHGLLRDEKHLAYGVGRYVAACTWFEALIAPVYNVSIMGNPAVHAITEDEQTNSTYETVPVTDLNRTLCQQCAASAVANPIEISFLQ